ncbi:MAG: hypothetical protein IT303_07750 [Dehalococcoidia bacterium]|nr:hypothetical protein [Dehalococcoidia bacterium]
MDASRANRLGTFGGLALVAVAASYALSATNSDSETVEPPREGTLVVANLRGESLTVLDIGRQASHGLALFGPPHEIATAGGRLYITLGRADALVEVDPSAPGVLRRVEFPGGTPHGVAIDGAHLHVTLDDTDELVRMDPATLAETGRTATGDTPHAVAAAGGAVFVTESRANTLRGPDGASYPTRELPESVALTDRYVVTANAAARTLTVFERANLAVSRNFELPGSPVRVIALGGDRVAVSLGDAARVYIVDVAEGNVVRKLDVADRPDGLCLSPDAAYLAVVSNAEDTVQVFATASWDEAATYDVGDGPGSCAWLPTR